MVGKMKRKSSTINNKLKKEVKKVSKPLHSVTKKGVRGLTTRLDKKVINFLKEDKINVEKK